MQNEDEICLCFGVTRRQLEKFIRLEKPVRSSQLSECYGAGTGCGWCRPFLEAMFETQGQPVIEMTAEEYAQKRAAYRRQKKDQE